MTAVRAPRHRDGGILAPFRSLLFAQTIGAVLGLVFWVAAARLVPASQVGVAAAAISVQTLLGLFTTLGLGTLMIAELPRHDPVRQRQLVLRSLTVVAVVGMVVGVLAAGVLGLLSDNLRAALSDPRALVVFVVGVAAAGCGLVLDEAVLGLKRSRVQVLRNAVAASLRFPLAAALLLAGSRDAFTLQLCWVLPLLVSLVVAWRRLDLPRTAPSTAPGAAPARDLATFARPAMHNYALNLSVAAPTQLVPVVAALALGAVANAEFAIAWLIATFVFLPPYLLATALFAHGANVSTEQFRHSMGTTLPAALGLSAILCAGAWLLGEPVLSVFGGRYAEQSYDLLALLVLAGFWMVVKDHLVALWRSQRRFVLATRLASAWVLLELAGAVTGGILGGGRGLCLGWLAAMGLEALLALPWLRHGLGGIRWQLPRMPARTRTEAGRAVWPLVAGIAVLLLTAVLGFVGATSTPSSTPIADDERTCRPTRDQPGPVVDLGIQPATGDPRRPLYDVATVERLVDLAAEGGASVISTSASWRFLQPDRDGAYDFRGLDRVLDAAERRGLDVRVKLVHTPEWARDVKTDESEWRPPTSGRELGLWWDFVAAVTEHAAGRADYLEVWTEPNSASYWTTGPDPAAFASLLRTSYDAVNSVDDDVSVVSGGLSGNDIGYLEGVYDELDAAGGIRPFDYVGVHPFTDGSAPSITAEGRRYDREPFGAFDENFLGYRTIHDVMVERGDVDIPLYIGEFGYSTDPGGGGEPVADAERAGYLVEAYNAAVCTPYVAVMSWYYLHPTPWDPPSWTLLDKELAPNVTYRALEQWARERGGGDS